MRMIGAKSQFGLAHLPRKRTPQSVIQPVKRCKREQTGQIAQRMVAPLTNCIFKKDNLLAGLAGKKPHKTVLSAPAWKRATYFNSVYTEASDLDLPIQPLCLHGDIKNCLTMIKQAGYRRSMFG